VAEELVFHPVGHHDFVPQAREVLIRQISDIRDPLGQHGVAAVRAGHPFLMALL
jgi:hypothetical protein